MSDFKVGATLYHHFSTRAFATGIPTTLAGTPVAEAYEEASAVGMTSGISLTIDHAETGHHLLTVVASSANSFETDKSYGVSLTAGTVDGVSVVGEVIFNFTLEKLSAPTTVQISDAVWDEAQLGHTASGSFGELATEIAAILVDTGTTLDTKLNTIDDFLDTEIAAITAAVITNAAGIDIAADIVAVKAETALIVADTNELQTDDIPMLIATLDAVVDTVKIDTAAILIDTAEIGTAGAGLTDLGGMSTGMKAEVNAEADTALADYDPPTNAEMVVRTLTAAQIAQLGQNLDNGFVGTASGTPSTATMVSDIGVTVDDQFNGRIITFDDDTTTAALRGQATDITSCTASSNTLTFTALTTAPVSGDTFVIT